MKRKEQRRFWDETDEWACRTFQGTRPSRRVMMRRGLQKLGDKASFEALFKRVAVAAA